MSDIKGNSTLNHDHCFVCGKNNPRGLGLNFHSDNGTTGCQFDVPHGFESYSGITHGGLLATLMDAAMARWLFDRGIIAFTGLMTVKFRDNVSPGEPLTLSAKKKNNRGRRYFMQATLKDRDGREVASAEAMFLQPKSEFNTQKSNIHSPISNPSVTGVKRDENRNPNQ